MPKKQEKRSELAKPVTVVRAGDTAAREVDANVALDRSVAPPDSAQSLWIVIRNRTIDFNQYKTFIDDVMCCVCDPLQGRGELRKEATLDMRLPFPGVRAYNLLKLATELYLMQECGVFPSKKGLGIKSGTDGEPCLEPMENFTERFDSDEEAARAGHPVGDASTVLQDLRDNYLEDLEFEVRGGSTHIDVLPYLKIIREKLKDVPIKDPQAVPPNCYGILASKLSDPCLLELIWSYWHEEGMLAQSMNAIMRRFQNLRTPAATDPLANLEIDPLRPLNNLLWGHIQDEQHRLTLVRRGYEYDHHYGLRLVGKAVPEMRPADSRSKFLEGFHNLLHVCTIFFQQDDDTTVISDAFPVLNALREVHLTLAQGAHNQFGDLPWTSRLEMLTEMWLLARTEMREFLRGRIMVPYPEPWMDAVDHMKKLQGWTDTSVREFRDLAVFGEQLLLSIRYDNWGTYNDANIAKLWARYWRQEIQRYVHAYRAVTGVDLSTEPVNSTLPAVLLQRRLAAQMARAR